MIRSILNGHNLRRASRQVVSNKGSAGIDGIPVQELIGYFDTQEAAMLFIPEGTTEKEIQTRAEQLADFERNKAQIVESIMTGKYLPQPIRGVEIPKENGKKRLLGIPKLLSYYFVTVSCRNRFSFQIYGRISYCDLNDEDINRTER